jgi:uncharacterized membrane protein YccC
MAIPEVARLRRVLREVVSLSAVTPNRAGSAHSIEFKAHGRAGRFARRYASAIETSRFVLRCSLAASVAYGLAVLIGFEHPVWAPLEALIVSQESIGDTFESICGRLVGTLLGVITALLVGTFGGMAGFPLVLQIALSVTVCALATFGRPSIRACLWTCPLVLVMAPSLGTPQLVGIIRVSQVLLGALVGGLMHVLDRKLWESWKALFETEVTTPSELPFKLDTSHRLRRQ